MVTFHRIGRSTTINLQVIEALQLRWQFHTLFWQLQASTRLLAMDHPSAVPCQRTRLHPHYQHFFCSWNLWCSLGSPNGGHIPDVCMPDVISLASQDMCTCIHRPNSTCIRENLFANFIDTATLCSVIIVDPPPPFGLLSFLFYLCTLELMSVLFLIKRRSKERSLGWSRDLMCTSSGSRWRCDLWTLQKTSHITILPSYVYIFT